MTDTGTSNRPTCFSGNCTLGTCCLFLTALASDHSVDKELPTFTHKGHHILLQSSTQQLLLQYCHYDIVLFLLLLPYKTENSALFQYSSFLYWQRHRITTMRISSLLCQHGWFIGEYCKHFCLLLNQTTSCFITTSQKFIFLLNYFAKSTYFFFPENCLSLWLTAHPTQPHRCIFPPKKCSSSGQQ